MQCIIAFGLFSPIDEIPCKRRRRRKPQEEEEEQKRSKLNSTHQCFI
jgi:hypothetical protein